MNCSLFISDISDMSLNYLLVFSAIVKRETVNQSEKLHTFTTIKQFRAGTNIEFISFQYA